ncbi:C-type mannose receptor 2-like [Anneissia japonica]|uniref:C-type mannose receptor 2-like n=1 Tax=Anneissia japonica TaxID=1529436 RepID=UPI0014259978|nr:C-type mannose receptor 2-like [Anneissia japonica]
MIIRIIIFSVLAGCVCSQGCGKDWQQFGNTCYFASQALVPWSTARDTCKDMDADLAIIRNNEANQFLQDLLGFTRKLYWIGLQDKKGEGNFLWVDNTPLDPTKANWLPGEPNDYRRGEDCGEINTKKNGQWNDETCVTPQPYICSKNYVDVECDENNGWINYNNKCYLWRSVELQTWTEAETFCTLLNGNLVSIGSQDEQNFVNDILQQFKGTGMWIGLTDRESIAGSFYWTDRSPTDYLKWDDNQPDTRYFDGGGDCVQIQSYDSSSDGLWVTAPCYQAKNYMCEAKEGACSAGWKYYNGQCYQCDMNKRRWADAKSFCEAQGGYLATITSEGENLFIATLFTEFWMNVRHNVWFGLSDSKQDGNFQWVQDVDLGYTSWNIDNPTDRPNQVDCGSINTGNNAALWNTIDCNYEQAFICKIQAGRAVTNLVADEGVHSCTGDWQAHGSYCYLFKPTDFQRYWDAEGLCAKEGGTLVTITSQEEQDFISVRADILRAEMWIGLHDTATKGKFEWIDGSSLSFTNWAPGEPNEAGSGEDCVSLVSRYSRVGMWNDLSCDRHQPYICKRPYDSGGGPIIPVTEPAARKTKAPSESLTGGAIAGITVGFVCVLVLVSIMTVIFVRKNEQRKLAISSPSNTRDQTQFKL